MVFPTDAIELAKMKRGLRCDAVLPLPDGENFASGDRLSFREATGSSFTGVTYVPGGDSVTVTLIKARYDGEFKGEHLHFVEWEPLSEQHTSI